MQNKCYHIIIKYALSINQSPTLNLYFFFFFKKTYLEWRIFSLIFLIAEIGISQRREQVRYPPEKALILRRRKMHAKERAIEYENKVLVDVILSNGLIDIWFAPFPGTAMSLQRNMPAFFPLPPPPPGPGYKWGPVRGVSTMRENWQNNFKAKGKLTKKL